MFEGVSSDGADYVSRKTLDQIRHFKQRREHEF